MMANNDPGKPGESGINRESRSTGKNREFDFILDVPVMEWNGMEYSP